MTQDEFLKEALAGKNILLTGAPGTGKTYITKRLIEELKAQDKVVIVVAPTGIAALNIEGSTIHSAFKIHPGDMTYVPRQNIDWEFVDVVIYDECSMIGPDMFEFNERIIKQYIPEHEDKPFGGIQIIMVGDFDQLPPVYKKVDPEDKEYYDKLIALHGGDKCIDAHAFKNGGFMHINLSEVFRQKDERLLSVITNIKSGELSAIQRLQRSGWSAMQWIDSVHLMPYNSMVDSYNKKAFDKISNKPIRYEATIKGKFNTKNVLTPEQLDLKQGCRIMITKNLKNGLMNGDLGYASSIDVSHIVFKSDRTGDLHHIMRETWEQFEYVNGDKVSVGSFNQIPVKLAYAITIHKAQGLSLDKLIVHYIPSMSKEQLYVAISRATNYENLFVTGN